MPERPGAGSILNPEDKIATPGEAVAIRRNLGNERKSVVFTNGCFDILHAGHAAYLFEARKKGDFLIVGVNSDASIRRKIGRASCRERV